MMAHRIVLFDIDGTLVTTDGAGRRSLEATFEDHYQRSDCLEFSFAGMTDRLIMQQALETMGEPVLEETVERLIDAYVERLPEHVAEAPGYRIYEGVPQVLDEVSTWSQTAVGLGTGNIERGARIKLERGELNDYFAFGGFGCDAADRAELIRAGAHRGARQLGLDVQECRVLVVGDTARDVHAAHAIGAKCLAVATGSTARADLDDAGADWSVETLADRSVVEILRDGAH